MLKSAKKSSATATTTERAPKRARIEVSKGKGKNTAEPSAKPTKLKSTNSQEKKLKPKKTKAASKPKDEVPEPLPTSFQIIAGSYEKLLYGLQGSVSLDANNETTWSLAPVFIFPAHVSCIKAVAASPGGGKWLASGSADEIIKVWDLRRRKEIGGLMHHEGSITHLAFPSRSHLLSASEDGTLCLFRARDWAVLRSLKGHKGRVNSLAVHPSGKVALSVGKDRALRMWDLMRGKGAASTKLGKEGEVVRWSTDGEIFAVQAQKTVDVYSSTMTLLHTITHPSRIHDILFTKHVGSENDVSSGHLLLVGAEDKKLSIYHISPPPAPAAEDEEPTPSPEPKIIAAMVGHENRVKAVQSMRIALPSSSASEPKSTTLITTISSDGFVHLYDLAKIAPGSRAGDVSPVAKYDSKGTRLTCVAFAEGGSALAGLAEENDVGEKRKRDEDGSDGDSEDGFEMDGKEVDDEDDDDEEEEEDEE